MTRTIYIDKKNFFFIDDDDYDRCKHLSWYKGKDGYVYTKIDNRQVNLGRFILNYDNRRKVHYRNGNVNDGRKRNLYVRVAKAIRADRRREKDRLSRPENVLH